MRIYVTEEFLTYLTGNFFQARKGDENYASEFDVNNDGIINTLDITWFSQRLGQWVDTPTYPNWLLIGSSLVGGLVLGLLLSRL